MFLVDTSVWIDYLRKRPTRAVGWFEQILEHDLPYGIIAPIYQEILQGADSPESLERLESYLSTLHFYQFIDPVASHGAAARLYFECRRRGLTIRSTIDCLIAQAALEHDLWLLHNDRDFHYLALAAPDLRLYCGSLAHPESSEIHQEEAEYQFDP